MKQIEVRNRRRVLALLVGFAAVIGRPLKASGEDELRARVLTEAPKAWAKISTWAEHLEMTTSSRTERGNTSGKTDAHIKLSGGNCLVNFRYFEPDGTAGSEDVFCRNAGYSFQLRRSGPKLPWLVKRFSRTPNTEVDQYFEAMAVSVLSKPQLGVGPVYFPDVFGKEPFVIKEVKSRRQGTTELVSVSFENALPKTEKPVRWLSRGTVTLNPDLAWVIQDCDVHVEFADGITWHLQLENNFNSPAGGIPVLKSQRGRINIADQPEATSTRAVSDLNNRRIPEEEFTLTAFGLPEKMPP